MRRKDREVTDFNEIVKIIDECEIVRLGLSDGDYPYIVPMNFGYQVVGQQIELFIHGAMSGKKYEMFQKNPYCSFEMDRPLQLDCMTEQGDVTMRYQCVMGKATAQFLEGEEKQKAIDHAIMARWKETKNFRYNKAAVAKTAVIKLLITEMTAKVNPVRTISIEH